MRRPPSVTFTAVIALLAAAIAAVTGFSLAHPGTPLDRIWQLNPPAHAAFAAVGRLSGYLLFGVAAVSLVIALGLLRGRHWAWFLALATFAVNGLGDLANALYPGQRAKAAAGFLVAVLFLVLLLRPRVRAFFIARG